MANYAYSFSGVSGSIVMPNAGVMELVGQQGVNSIAISMAYDKTSTKMSSDGAGNKDYRLGNPGTITINALEASDVMTFFRAEASGAEARAAAADVSTLLDGTVLIRVPNLGRTHSARGVTVKKMPDTSYGAEATFTDIVLDCLEIITEVDESQLTYLSPDDIAGDTGSLL